MTHLESDAACRLAFMAYGVIRTRWRKSPLREHEIGEKQTRPSDSNWNTTSMGITTSGNSTHALYKIQSSCPDRLHSFRRMWISGFSWLLIFRQPGWWGGWGVLNRYPVVCGGGAVCFQCLTDLTDSVTLTRWRPEWIQSLLLSSFLEKPPAETRTAVGC